MDSLLKGGGGSNISFYNAHSNRLERRKRILKIKENLRSGCGKNCMYLKENEILTIKTAGKGGNIQGGVSQECVDTLLHF